MHRWTPFVQHFRQRHLGSTIALKLDGMLEKLDLTDPEILKFCVNDNAANMQHRVLLKIISQKAAQKISNMLEFNKPNLINMVLSDAKTNL